MSISLSKFDTKTACDQGAEIELRDPKTNSATGVFINIVGKDAQEFRDYTRMKTNERLRKEAMAQRRGKDIDARTVESIESENIELLVTCTKGWRGMIDDNGVEVPFSVQNAISLYKDYPSVYEQINEAIGDISNFLK